MDRKTYSLMTVLGSSFYLVLGFISLGNLTTLGTTQYSLSTIPVALWGETILSLLLGFVLLVASWYIASMDHDRARYGGALGLLGAVSGTLDGIALMSINAPYGSALSGFVTIAGVFVVFLGFPLVFTGAFGGLRLSESVAPQQTQT